jgi:uncharacterized membrane protein YidH (DUF202 family)
MHSKGTSGTSDAAPGRGHLFRLLPSVVAVLGIIASLALAGVAAKAPGVFWTQLQVRFLYPASNENPNNIALSSSGVVITAGVVEKQLEEIAGPRLTSPGTTLAAQGIKHGWSVNLPNSGGQWANNFVDPFLDVQVVGSSPDEVITTANQLVAKIRNTLAGMQAQAGVDRFNTVTTQLSPPAGPPLYFMRGSRARALAASFVIGLSITFAAAASTRFLVRRASGNNGEIDPDAEQQGSDTASPSDRDLALA